VLQLQLPCKRIGRKEGSVRLWNISGSVQIAGKIVVAKFVPAAVVLYIYIKLRKINSLLKT
jgi:hypothetical protein